MAVIRVAMAQCNAVVGDIEDNSRRVVDIVQESANHGAQLVVFPEMFITGYPIEDLVYRESVIAASEKAVADIAQTLQHNDLGAMVVVVGYLAADAKPEAGKPASERGPRNRAAFLHNGTIVDHYDKHHLPNYGVFDEDRYFVSGTRFPILRLAVDNKETVDIGLSICEDLWQDGGPVKTAYDASIDLLLVLNGSPYEQGKSDYRLDLCRLRAHDARATVAYINLVGGQDELVFDGDSMIVTPGGQLLARAERFTEQLLIVDLDLPGSVHQQIPAAQIVNGFTTTWHAAQAAALPATSLQRIPAPVAESLSPEAETYTALVTGLADYVHKNAFTSVVLGISGGIDSALCAAIAVDALGPHAVHGVLMPSPYSSDHSIDDATELAERLGLPYRALPIEPVMSAYNQVIPLEGLAAENIQARIRGALLMAISNSEGHLTLTTGNKSEIAVGYSTLYGDSVGGFAPLKDVVKTWVWKLATWRNEQALKEGQQPPIPENSITKPPSAELRPDQLDTDSLPDYGILDDIITRYVDADESLTDIIAAGHIPDQAIRIIGLIDRAEFKRRQAAPGPKLGVKAFGRDRRLPITNRWKEHRQ